MWNSFQDLPGNSSRTFPVIHPWIPSLHLRQFLQDFPGNSWSKNFIQHFQGAQGVPRLFLQKFLKNFSSSSLWISAGDLRKVRSFQGVPSEVSLGIPAGISRGFQQELLGDSSRSFPVTAASWVSSKFFRTSSGISDRDPQEFTQEFVENSSKSSSGIHWGSLR